MERGANLDYFVYGELEKKYLIERDPKLGRVILEMQDIKRPINSNLFESLMTSIISQQISSKAATTVWSRFKDLVGSVSPENVMALSLDEIQKQGMSFRKAGYIKEIAERVSDGDLNLKTLETLPDCEVIKRLKSLPGIGVWTAEMLMLFSMRRPDILSWDDLAIRRGMLFLYGLDTIDRTTFETYRKVYSPYGSVASLYLWEISHKGVEKRGK